MYCRIGRDRAQALVWLTLAVPLFISLAGLAIDGSVLLSSRRQLQSSVDGAARAAATRLDTPRLRASGGADIQLDPTLADRTARGYLDQAFASDAHSWQGLPQTDVEIGARRVRVEVRAELRTAFLQIVRIDTVPVEASAFADVQYGIHDGFGD